MIMSVEDIHKGDVISFLDSNGKRENCSYGIRERIRAPGLNQFHLTLVYKDQESADQRTRYKLMEVTLSGEEKVYVYY